MLFFPIGLPSTFRPPIFRFFLENLLEADKCQNLIAVPRKSSLTRYFDRAIAAP